jgi:hypothetical protein
MRTFSPWEQLNEILDGDDGRNIRQYDQEMASEPPVNFSLVLSSRSSRMADIGSLITQTDREVRRGVTIFMGERDYLGEEGNRPRPISPNYGGLRVADAAPGSLHMLLEAYGEAVTLLNSKPLQALIAALTLYQSGGSIRLWRRRKKDPLAGISARQLLEIIKEYGGDTQNLMRGQNPDLKIEMQEAGDEVQSYAEVLKMREDISPHILSGREDRFSEIIQRGRRITYISNYPDGSQNIIYVDGY